jgi:hypothetical protein
MASGLWCAGLLSSVFAVAHANGGPTGNADEGGTPTTRLLGMLQSWHIQQSTNLARAYTDPIFSRVFHDYLLTQSLNPFSMPPSRDDPRPFILIHSDPPKIALTILENGLPAQRRSLLALPALGFYYPERNPAIGGGSWKTEKEFFDHDHFRSFQKVPP